MVDEIIKEEVETENPSPKEIESGETVVTEPASSNEDNSLNEESKIDLVQLETRVTSLEQRLQSYEESIMNKEQSDNSNFVDKKEPTEVDDEGIESTDEIKDILNL